MLNGSLMGRAIGTALVALFALVLAVILIPNNGQPGDVPQEPTATTTTTSAYITEQQAVDFAAQYWNIQPGDKDPDTGFMLSIHTMEAPTADDPRYRMALRWLVETEGEASHYSTLDVVYVDAYTGAVALPE